jgi:hypothetical protein
MRKLMAGHLPVFKHGNKKSRITGGFIEKITHKYEELSIAMFDDFHRRLVVG